MTPEQLDRGRWIAGLVALLLLAWPGMATAQQGAIEGRVVDENGTAVQNAEVQVLGQRIGAFTAADGTFRIRGVPAGTHTLEVRQPGFRKADVTAVEVRAGEITEVEVTLVRAPYELGGLVVSASRQTERITEAPATITKIGEDEILNSTGNSFNGALKQVQGLEFIQTGITAVAINARGFNSSFNNRMLQLEDGRVAVLPENGLPVGQFTAIPKVDLEGVEVLVGPGASLYGQDASNGVISLQTKDPKEHPGTIVEVAGGTRDYYDVQFRHAGVLGDGHWGYKFAGEWQEADDFANRLVYGTAENPLPEVDADWTTSVARAEGSVVYYDDEVNNLRVEATGGWSQSDAIGQTNVGRNQIEDWSYSYQQIRASTDNLYFSAYRTHSQSGETFALNQFTENRAAFPGLSTDSVRKLSDFPSSADLFAADFQHNFRIPELLNTRLVWGGQFRHDEVSSKRQWLTDRFTGEDIGIDQGGVFAQTETPLTSRWKLTLGARWDDHQDYESQFSPTAGISFSPTADQTLRFTYREAFKSPTTLQTRFFIPSFVPFVGVFGNRNGFTVVDGAGNVVDEVDPLVPEVNETFELGYKGVLADRLYLDAALWYADYQDFLGSLLPINDPFTAGTVALDDEGEVIMDNGVPLLVLTYQNQGNAELAGIDMGASYAVTEDVLLKGTFSWLDLRDSDEAPAVNAPPVRWTVGADFENILGSGSAGFLVRHTTGYPFTSGINVGRIPTFETLDVNLGYDLPWQNTEVMLQAENLFTCRKLESTGGVALNPPHLDEGETLDGSHSCGFDKPHVEMVNMPGIETTVFLGFRWRS
jgi:iron complex outermembrane receptor protein